MTISITPRFGFTVWESLDDQVTMEQFTGNFSAIEALGAQCQIGALAERPAPGAGQLFFYAEDADALFYDTGSAWQRVLFSPDIEVTAGTRPLPGVDGRYVFETDANRLYRDLGPRYLEIVTSTILPAGMIMPTVAAAQPAGWLFCDGSAYGPDTYPDLFAAIGTRFGSSGSNFRVPDLRNLFLAGAPTLGSVGAAGLGAHTHPAHDHTTAVEFVDHVHSYLEPTGSSGDTFSGIAQEPSSPYTGLGGTSESEVSSEVSTPASANLLTFSYVSYLIKATGGAND